MLLETRSRGNIIDSDIPMQLLLFISSNENSYLHDLEKYMIFGRPGSVCQFGAIQPQHSTHTQTLREKNVSTGHATNVTRNLTLSQAKPRYAAVNLNKPLINVTDRQTDRQTDGRTTCDAI